MKGNWLQIVLPHFCLLICLLFFFSFFHCPISCFLVFRITYAWKPLSLSLRPLLLIRWKHVPLFCHWSDPTGSANLLLFLFRTMRKPWRRSRRLLASAMANRFQQMTCKWPKDLFFFRPAVGNFLVNLHSTGKERKIIAQHNSVSVLRLQGTKAAYTTMEWCFAISVTSGKEEKSPRISPQHQPVTTLRPPAADEKTRRRARFQTWSNLISLSNNNVAVVFDFLRPLIF